MTIEKLIDCLEKVPDKTKDVLIQCLSPGGHSWMFQKLESVELQLSGRIILNVPGAKLPETVNGAEG